MRPVKERSRKLGAVDASSVIQANLFISANLNIDFTHRYEVILTPDLRFGNDSRLLGSHFVSLTLSVSLFVFHYFLN